MSINTKIFQIYFKPELLAHCDPDFEPMDNTDNPRSELREWDKWDREHENILAQNLDYWGFVSWKFKEKMNLTGRQVLDWIDSNPGYDVYLLNPCIINEAVFTDSWEQGDLHHEKLKYLAGEFLEKMQTKDIDLPEYNVSLPIHKILSSLMTRNNMVFANYVVGNRDFWQRFMNFSRLIFTESEKDPEFENLMFGEGLSNYAHDRTLPNFTFFIERIISTFIIIGQFKSLGYKHSHLTVSQKYQPLISDILALSDLKLAANHYRDLTIHQIWNYYRNKFVQENPGVLNLE